MLGPVPRLARTSPRPLSQGTSMASTCLGLPPHPHPGILRCSASATLASFLFVPKAPSPGASWVPFPLPVPFVWNLPVRSKSQLALHLSKRLSQPPLKAPARHDCTLTKAMSSTGHQTHTHTHSAVSLLPLPHPFPAPPPGCSLPAGTCLSQYCSCSADTSLAHSCNSMNTC